MESRGYDGGRGGMAHAEVALRILSRHLLL